MIDPERRAEVLVRLPNAVRPCAHPDERRQKALDGAAKIITRNYLERCVTDAVNGGDPLIYDELMMYRSC